MNEPLIIANKKEFDGHIFASGLELFCYKKLKESGLRVEYEFSSFRVTKDKNFLFDFYKRTKKKGYHKAKSHKIAAINHTPDFLIFDKDGMITHIIETKGFSSDKFQIYRRLFFIYAAEKFPRLSG